MVKQLSEQLELMTNKVRFILMIVNGELEARKKKKKVLCEELNKLGFKVNEKDAKKKKVSAEESDPLDSDYEDDVEMNEVDIKILNGYDYLLRMTIHSLTQEKVSKLQKIHGLKKEELNKLRSTPIKRMWLNDLEELETELALHNAEEQEQIEKAMELEQ